MKNDFSAERHEQTWDEVHVPGLPQGAYRFNLPAGRKEPNRLAFNSHTGLKFAQHEILEFNLHSPTSSAMFPDILAGDHGYPSVSLENENGSIFTFARGNIKDFFEISKPNERQQVRLPLSAFLFDIYLKDNVFVDQASFFNSPVKRLAFDFLSHPNVEIDIELSGLCVTPPSDTLELDFEQTVLISSAHTELPMFATYGDQLPLSVLLVDQVDRLFNKPLYWVLRKDGVVVSKGQVFLRDHPTPVIVDVPKTGFYRLDMRIESNGELVTRSERSLVRVLPPPEDRRATVLGISDETAYAEIAQAGGTFERKPIKLQSLEQDQEGEFQFRDDPFSMPARSADRARVFAFFALPRWLSRKADREDYYRYAPRDWTLYSRVTEWLAKKASAAGATHIEVWNEASVIGHWGDSMENLIKLHHVTYESVKRVNPTLTVLGGCTHSWSFEFLEEFLNQGGGDHCDGISLHGYTYDPTKCVEYFAEVERLHKAFNLPNDFGFYITELGFRCPAFSEWDQSQYLALFSLEAEARPEIRSLLWFRYINPRPESISNYNQRASAGYSMIGYQGMYCRPSFGAYRFLDNLLARHDRVSATSDGATRLYRLERQGVVQVIAVFDPDQNLHQNGIPCDWILTDHLGSIRDSQYSDIMRFYCCPDCSWL